MPYESLIDFREAISRAVALLSDPRIPAGDVEIRQEREAAAATLGRFLARTLGTSSPDAYAETVRKLQRQALEESDNP